MKRNFIYCIVFLMFMSASGMFAQNQVRRPPIFGIAKMTYLVSDFQIARDYYGTFLGFDEAFSYQSPLGEVISFKVNDRQFLEFVMDPDTRNKTRLVSVSLETTDVEQMRLYLQSRNWTVPNAVTVDGAGNNTILVHDDDGIPVEFIDMNPNSLHRKSAGRFLSERRISKRIHHAGLYSSKVVASPRFWRDILQCRELFRDPVDANEDIAIIYFQLPESVEFIEHFATTDQNFSHPCFVAESMQDVLYTLKERNNNRPVGSANVGRGRRYILNITNPDGTRVEFIEPYLVR